MSDCELSPRSHCHVAYPLVKGSAHCVPLTFHITTVFHRCVLYNATITEKNLWLDKIASGKHVFDITLTLTYYAATNLVLGSYYYLLLLVFFLSLYFNVHFFFITYSFQVKKSVSQHFLLQVETVTRFGFHVIFKNSVNGSTAATVMKVKPGYTYNEIGPDINVKLLWTKNTTLGCWILLNH
jgi:hypothetical protein